MNYYDIVIVGGGIAGIYTMFNLIQNYPNIKVLLLEKNNRFGGRIYTHKETINNTEYTMDFGAGRLGYHHILILKLLKKLNLKKNIIPIPNKKDYIEIKNNKSTLKTEYREKVMKKFFQFIKSKKISNLSNSFLQKFTLNEIINKYYNKTFLKKLENVFEYYQDLYYYNACDVINYFKYDYTNNAKYFTLNGGLSTIIDKMIKFIKNKNKFNKYKFKLNFHVNNIFFNNDINLYEIKNKNNSIFCKYLVCALPRKDLIHFDILKSFKPDLNSIKDINLLRIFEVYDKDKNKDNLWFNHVNKTVTNDELQFVIPINKNNGLIMSSYTELHNSDYWMKHYNNDKTKNKIKFKNLLNKKLSIAYNKNIPNSKWLKLYHWDMGVGSWNKNVNSNYLSNKIINLLPNFFICGENFSTYQAWCEGSLETSQKVLNLIDCLIKINKKNKTKKIKKSSRKKSSRKNTAKKISLLS
tara:strand:- start:1953 stop:3353 length:1401 start_codon:yes stop_codon:yes gene_type:complete